MGLWKMQLGLWAVESLDGWPLGRMCIEGGTGTAVAALWPLLPHPRGPSSVPAGAAG